MPGGRGAARSKLLGSSLAPVVPSRVPHEYLSTSRSRSRGSITRIVLNNAPRISIRKLFQRAAIDSDSIGLGCMHMTRELHSRVMAMLCVA